MILDWHEDLRTRCNLALREYLRTSGIPDQRVLILNIQNSDFYIVYSQNKILHCGEFNQGSAGKDEVSLFTTEFRSKKGRNLRFCEISFEDIARTYSYLLLDGFSPYCLDDQIVETVWEPEWGMPIVQTELDCFGSVESRKTEDGVICDFITYDENWEHPELQSSIFIPFDYRYNPAKDFIGCEVNGTFFLIYNHMSVNLEPID